MPACLLITFGFFPGGWSESNGNLPLFASGGDSSPGSMLARVDPMEGALIPNSVALAHVGCTPLEFLARETSDGPVALGRAEPHPTSPSLDCKQYK